VDLKIGDRVRMHPSAFAGLRRAKTFTSAELWVLVVGGRLAFIDGATCAVEISADVRAQLGRDAPPEHIRVWQGYLMKSCCFSTAEK